jgi:hypothetical protein
MTTMINEPRTAQEGYDFLVSHHCRFCEAQDVKRLMMEGLSFTDSCYKVAMDWLESEEGDMKRDLQDFGYYECSSEFSCFVHYLEQSDVFSRHSELWIRSCNLYGF